MPKRFLFLFSAVILFAIDCIMKAYVHRELPLIGSSFMVYPYGGIALFKDWHGISLAIVHVANKGAAWGLFASLQEYLLYLRMAIIGGLVSYLIFVKTPPYRKACFLLITVGALGNVLDYFLYGHVVDMIYFTLGSYSYPVFNFADSFICVGIFLLIAQRLIEKISSKKSCLEEAFLTHLRLSTPQVEGILQASKFLKVQVLLDPQELEHLFSTLLPCHLLNTSEPVEKGQEEIPLDALFQGYRTYVESLKQQTPAIPRALFSCALSKTLTPFYAFSLPNKKVLVKPTLPVIQLQAHTFFYSSFDQKFHSMVQGKESISWGLQFSFPQLYQNLKTKKIEKTSGDNRDLFFTLMQWMRSYSLPTPFCADGKQTSVPIRIGKKALSWIGQHRSLQSHHLSVNV